ncbi:hypothetical protein [Methanomassiliicoccus luminyensis]|uniref:hypothetical protein n=1 Tax=Methanomassiliicoccus luminyensis TaxID=1080712 RepID=UPI0003818765|nr:hypothetical protein [Methanomassiliicoccus luminyensis]
MALCKLVAFFLMFASVVAVAAAVSTMVSGIVNVGAAGMRRAHIMDKMNLKKAAGSAAHGMGHHKMQGMHGMHGECKPEAPFEDVRDEDEQKKY